MTDIPPWRKDDKCVRCGAVVTEYTVDGVPFVFCKPCGELVEKEITRGKFLG